VADRAVILGASPRPVRRRTTRRRRLLTRGGPVLVVAAVAFGFGARVATGPGRAERRMVSRYVADWTHGETAAMYQLLDGASRARVSETQFSTLLSHDRSTATAHTIAVGRIGAIRAGTVPVAMTVATRLWGTLHLTLHLPLSGSGGGARVRLQSSMLFPGLAAGQSLSRRVSLPPRAALLAADGVPLAQGPDRTSPIPDVADQVVGTLGPPSPSQARADMMRGDPAGAQVGHDGLEQVFEDRLAGRSGGQLLAGSHVIASSQPVEGAAVRTSIVPSLEQAVVAALGGRYAGMVVMDPRSGALEAVAGLAYDAPQPPGSTMKIVTATAALQAHLVTISTEFPELSQVTIAGYTMQNAGGEVCGGTLLNAFAVSCNSTFAPLGVRVGARRLIAAARRYGFDEPSSIPGALESTIPSAASIGGPLEVGSSAIGQGLVLATPLEMADVTATIADSGRRPVPTFAANATPRYVRVTSAAVASEVQKMMVAVVAYGTGAPAQIPGITIAGKTGTAELRSTASKAASANPKNTDSWFVAYAPVGNPKVAIAALFPGAGYGAAIAAPAVRSVVESALAG
jgi:peptidoglycan glycosyltransferase